MAAATSRKWLITINNPLDHGFDHARIRAAILDLPNILYWCMCDEQGDECETLHTHVFLVALNVISHASIDARFPSFHRDIARGKSSENRAYVLKNGDKFNKQPDGSYSYKDTGGHLHEGINFSDTFEEGGELPDERQGKSRDADKIVELIKSGASNEEIVDAVASSYRDLEKIERVRSMYRDAQFKDSWRELEVTYIFGKTGSGKTRSVMDKYGYSNCFRVTDYKHPLPVSSPPLLAGSVLWPPPSPPSLSCCWPVWVFPCAVLALACSSACCPLVPDNKKEGVCVRSPHTLL